MSQYVNRSHDLPFVQRIKSLVSSNLSQIWIDPLILSILVLLIHAWSINNYPAPFVDEVWFISRSWGFIETGSNLGQLDQGVLNNFDGYWTYFPFLPSVVQSMGLRIFSEPLLLPARWVSLFFGMLLAVAIYSIGRNLISRKAGLLGAFFLIISPPFFSSSHLARPDIYAVALGFCAIALWTSNNSGNLLRSFFSGLIAGLAFEMHPNAAVYTPIIILLHLWSSGISFFRTKQFLYFAAGVAAALGYYFVIHILPYPQTYFSIQEIVYNTTHNPLGWFTMSIDQLTAELLRVAVLLFLSHPITIPLLLWSLSELCKKESSGFSHREKTLFVLAIGLVLLRIFWVRNWMFYYIILYSPVFDLLLGVWIIMFIKNTNRSLRPWKRATNFGLIGILLFILMFTSFFKLYIDWSPASSYAQDRINQNVAPNDRILAAQT